MAIATSTARARTDAAGLQGLRATLAQRLAQYRLYRQTLNELNALTDRELADLGIHRADVRSIAEGAAYRA